MTLHLPPQQPSPPRLGLHGAPIPPQGGLVVAVVVVVVVGRQDSAGAQTVPPPVFGTTKQHPLQQSLWLLQLAGLKVSIQHTPLTQSNTWSSRQQSEFCWHDSPMLLQGVGVVVLVGAAVVDVVVGPAVVDVVVVVPAVVVVLVVLDVVEVVVVGAGVVVGGV